MSTQACYSCPLVPQMFTAAFKNNLSVLVCSFSKYCSDFIFYIRYVKWVHLRSLPLHHWPWFGSHRETTDVWPLVFSLAFFSMFIFPSSSWLPQSLVGLPSCHIVLERFLNTVLSSCHPVFYPTIHPSIPSFFPPLWSLCLSPGGFLDSQRCVYVCICVCACWDSNKCQVGIYRWAVMEPLQMLSGLSSSTTRLPFPLCAFFLAHCVLE